LIVLPLSVDAAGAPLPDVLLVLLPQAPATSASATPETTNARDRLVTNVFPLVEDDSLATLRSGYCVTASAPCREGEGRLAVF
jgi:hypothetical protein